MKVYLNKEYKCVKVEDNTFVANDSSNYIRYYFVTNANGDVIDKMDDTSVIYRNTEPSYVTVAFRRADGDVIQHLMASPKTDATGKSFFEYEITNTDGVLYKKGALEISAQFIEATLSETGGVKKVISQKVKAIAINTAHVLDNIGEEAEEYYSQYEQANNDAHAVLQAQITTNFNNIGTLQELTTDAKDDLVKAINEVDAHADANKSEIGDLSNLTTDEKTTIVGAINEVDQHADANKTEIGNLTALTTDEKATLVGAINEVDNHADNATTLANNAVATANNAVATANEAKTTAQTAETNANSAVDKATEAQRKAQEAITKAENNVYAVGFMTLQEAITAVNGYDNTVLKTNDNILVVAQGSPDLYVTSVEATNIPYNFTTVDKFNDDLVKNTVLQIGYYKVAFYETDGQPVTVAYQNVVVKSTDWVASTEFADFPYEAKIPLSNFVDYKTVPQVVFDIADTMSGNYAPICKSGDKCVYIYGKVQNEITLKTVITFAPNVNGASVVGGGYNNRGKWVASTTYAIDDLVYTDNGQYVCIEGITSTTSPEQDTQHWQATFVATGKTKNGLKFSGQNTDGSAVQKTFDGSTAVEVSFDETTMTAKEVNGVLKIGAKGTVPEALPATGAKITGNLPTSGWVDTQGYTYNGNLTLSTTNYTLVKTLSLLEYNTITGSLSNNKIKVQEGSNQYIYQYKSSEDTDDKITIYFGSLRNYAEIYIEKSSKNLYAKSSYSTVTALILLYNTDLTLKQYTISDTAIKTNSTVSMYLNNADEVRAYSKTDGSVVVEMDSVPTFAIPYTLQVVETSAEGAFEIINIYVPSIPDSPTSLPVTYKKVSGNLPTTGWSTLDEGWKENTLPAYRNWKSVTYGNGKYVAVAWDSDKGAYSTDGITWTEMGLPASQQWQSVTYGNGKFVAVVWGSGNGAYSTDGINWTSTTMPASRNWSSVTYGNDKFVAIATSSTDKGAYSADGINWVEMTLPASRDWSSVTYGNGKFVAVASSNGGKGAYSTDGINWTEMSMLVDYKTFQSVTYGNGTFVAVSGGSDKGAYSTDGITWREMGMSMTSRNWSVTYGNDKFVAVAYGSSEVVYSTNGIDWRHTSSYSRSWNDVTYGNGKFVAIASNDLYYEYWETAVTYAISDTSITANTSVKMYLTDAGGVKAYSKANGSIQVIRDTVPTTAIPYEYEVEQTSTDGLFEVINAYVPDVPTKTSQLTNDSGFVKTSEANTFTAVQTFSNADGIKTDRVHNLDNNDAWYNFDGSNNRFGSPSRPTIIRTSEARPRAQVPSGSSTVTKEIALLEDIPSAGAWVDVTGETATLTQAGTYQVLFGSSNSVQSIIYWDGTNGADGIYSTMPSVTSGRPFINCRYPHITAAGVLSINYDTITEENGTWTKTTSTLSGFKYRKIN